MSVEAEFGRGGRWQAGLVRACFYESFFQLCGDLICNNGHILLKYVDLYHSSIQWFKVFIFLYYVTILCFTRVNLKIPKATAMVSWSLD